jgi:hypothetical protein
MFARLTHIYLCNLNSQQVYPIASLQLYGPVIDASSDPYCPFGNQMHWFRLLDASIFVLNHKT